MKVKNNGLPYRIGDSITKCSKMFKLFEIKNKRNAVNSTFLLLFNTAADRNRIFMHPEKPDRKELSAISFLNYIHFTYI